MTPMGRYIAAADALAEWLIEPVAVHFDREWMEGRMTRFREYRAAREAITAAGVNDMNEGKEG